MSRGNVDLAHRATEAFNRRDLDGVLLAVEIEDIRDLGEVLVVGGQLCGQGSGSGAAFERTLWMAEEGRDAKVRWWYAHPSEAGTLDAAEGRG